MSMLLLVEDNPDDEILIKRLLKKNNIDNEIVVARDGQQAIDCLFGSGEYQGYTLPIQPYVVLLDLNLPKVDGFEVLKRIRTNALTHTLPVILLTAANEEKDIIMSYGLGVSSYIRKPVDNKAFDDAVRQLKHCLTSLIR